MLPKRPQRVRVDASVRQLFAPDEYREFPFQHMATVIVGDLTPTLRSPCDHLPIGGSRTNADYRGQRQIRGIVKKDLSFSQLWMRIAETRLGGWGQPGKIFPCRSLPYFGGKARTIPIDRTPCHDNKQRSYEQPTKSHSARSSNSFLLIIKQ